MNTSIDIRPNTDIISVHQNKGMTGVGLVETYIRQYCTHDLRETKSIRGTYGTWKLERYVYIVEKKRKNNDILRI